MRVEITLDCNDLQQVAGFWAAALGYAQSPTVPGHYISLVPPHPHGVTLTLQAVPEPKSTKNRMHLDVLVPDVAAELERLLSLGARQLSPRKEAYGTSWYGLADPEGNEFCLGREPPDKDPPDEDAAD